MIFHKLTITYIFLWLKSFAIYLQYLVITHTNNFINEAQYNNNNKKLKYN